LKKQSKKIIKKTEQSKVAKFFASENRALPFYIIFGFAFILYANTLNYGYVLDDGLMIEHNNFTKKGIDGIADIFTHDQLGGSGGEASAIYQGGRYRPLSQVLFALEVEVFGLSPFFGHLIQVLMYSLLCILIFITLKKIFINYKADKWFISIPFVAALLFAAHPIHTEVAANIKSADEVMCMLGAILSLYFSLQYIDRGKISDLFLSFTFFLFGIFSKENAVTFIAIVPLTIYFSRKADLKKHIIVLIPLIAATAAYFITRFLVVGFSVKEVEIKELFHNPFLYATTAERYATTMFTWLKYLQLLVFPHPLTSDYYPKQIPIINWADARAIVPVIIYMAMGIFALIKIKRKNIIAYCIFFYLITFSVTSNLLINIGLFMNERFMFIPSLGFIIILAYFIGEISKRFSIRNTKNWAYVALISILFFYSIKTITRNTAWKDNYTLYTTDVKTSVNSARCNVIAGSMILNKARLETNTELQKSEYLKAFKYFKKGVELHNRHIEGWDCLGEVSIYLEKFDTAEMALKRVLQLDTLNKAALNNLYFVGVHYQGVMLDEKALSIYNYLISEKPDPKYYYNIAEIYNRRGKFDTSITLLEDAIKLNPDYFDAYNRIAEYYGKEKNNIDKALEYLKKAYSLNSQFEPTLENIGILYGMKADYKNSILFLEKAFLINPSNYSVCSNLANSYGMMGDKEKAKEYLLRANMLAQKK